MHVLDSPRTPDATTPLAPRPPEYWRSQWHAQIARNTAPPPKAPRGPRVILRGEANPLAKLTDAQVLAIRQQYASTPATQAAIAAEYGVSHSHVSRLVSGVRWSHLPLAEAVS